jgi:hypothetical protein
MDPTLPAITPQMRSALAASGGAPIQVQDPETLQVYLVSEKPIEVTLDEEYIRQGVQVARDQFARGEYSAWDMDATIAEAKRRHAERPNG